MAMLEFLWARFRHGGSILRDGLRVRWSWNATNKWSPPDNARLAFADQPFLYKLYLISRLPPARAIRPTLAWKRTFSASFCPSWRKSYFRRLSRSRR